jgi:PAT family beta-lactamase induction signal transducer AmpG
VVIPRTFANASTGFLIEAMGYTGFFLLCAAVAVPGMLMLLRVAPWNGK